MRLLLDTHVWLWLQSDPDRLGKDVVATLEDERNELLLSAVSSWEIAIKSSLGRLPLPEDPATYVPSRMQRHGVIGLPVEHAHALAVHDLPQHHRDPFDRLLIAQAYTEQLTVVTVDREFRRYDIDLLEGPFP